MPKLHLLPRGSVSIIQVVSEKIPNWEGPLSRVWFEAAPGNNNQRHPNIFFEPLCTNVLRAWAKRKHLTLNRCGPNLAKKQDRTNDFDIS